MKLNDPRKQTLERLNLWQQANPAKLYLDLLQYLKTEPAKAVGFLQKGR